VVKKAWRGTVAVKHAYFPDSAKLVTYNFLSADIVNRMHKYWGDNIGRGKGKRKKKN
jgi:hypothetical protein